MNGQNTGGLQGTRLPDIGRNGAALLSKVYRNRLIALANALANLEVICPQSDGQNVNSALKAQVDISELSMRITLPPSGGGPSSTTSVPFSGSGVPSATTLSSGSYVAGPTPSLYVDLTGLALWVCTGPGSNSTSTWSQVGVSGLQFPTVVSTKSIRYDSTRTYNRGDVVFVDQYNSDLGSSQAWPGLWVATNSVPIAHSSGQPSYFPCPLGLSAQAPGSNFDATNIHWMPMGDMEWQWVITGLSNADYVTAALWDGVNQSSATFTIAKPTQLRTSLSSELIDSVTVTYTAYTADNTRTATDNDSPPNSEYEVVCPRFIAVSGTPNTQNVIKARLVYNGTGVSSTTGAQWLEITMPNFRWLRRYVQ
jgi:hypothetical protein